METTEALSWLDTIAAGAGLLWFAGAWFVARAARAGQPLRGEVDVGASPAAVTSRLARQLADAKVGSPLQSCTIEAATEREVRWSSRGPLRHQGTAQANGDSRRAHVVFEVTTRQGLLLGARILVVVGFAVTVGLYLLLREFVATSENPALRGQVFQMAQAIHVLWPPFLLAGLSQRLRRLVGDEVRRIVQNTPFA